MTLLQEIRDGAIQSDTELAVVLRKCKILARQLGHAAFDLWVHRELNGYRDESELPNYRILRVSSKGNFIGFYNKWSNAPIPSLCLPEQYRPIATTAYMFEGVSYFETLIKNPNQQVLGSEWPADLTASYATEIYEGWTCVRAWREIPYPCVVMLIDTIRSRILNFVLELEAEAPELGESKPDKPNVNQSHISQSFTNLILGGYNTLAIGSSHTVQNTSLQVAQGDLESLTTYLSSLGVAAEDLSRLLKAIQEDGDLKEKKGLGKKVSGWLGKMTSQAVSGGWEGMSAAAAELLFKALCSYYGVRDWQ